jgi:acetolactate synthase regulatory subunit
MCRARCEATSALTEKLVKCKTQEEDSAITCGEIQVAVDRSYVQVATESETMTVPTHNKHYHVNCDTASSRNVCTLNSQLSGIMVGMEITINQKPV